MSRIGKKPIIIPAAVRVSLAGRVVTVAGPKGTLVRALPPEVDLSIGEGQAAIFPMGSSGSSRKVGAFWGLARSLVANMVQGVATGFEKKLEFEGIGFRAAMEGNILVMSLGFSHPVRFSPVAGITIQTEKQTIMISGADKEAVGMTAAAIRHLKRPEPYKGKGIRYQGEVLRRKAGKKAVASA
ncbi:MAG: ribosomal protein L6, bacterial type [Parcubacteria group bacterium Greene0714_36]|nr:MAG: ribosomal protein L6, bacterial type [Parcubacteria group bacterium Greene0714_36]